jgi:hypothetical protein
MAIEKQAKETEIEKTVELMHTNEFETMYRVFRTVGKK